MTDEIKAQIVSPEVAGNQVTFRLRAPDAEQVVVTGVQTAGGDGPSSLPLAQDAQGIWIGTLTGLDPQLYSYSFEVDGTRIADPSNRDVKKWLSCESMFEIQGGLLHENKQVPHGELHELFYDSNTVGQQRPALVYVPPAVEPNAEYPLVFLLHGFGDDFRAWKEVGRANLILDNLIAEKKCESCFVVMPYGHPKPVDLKQEFEEYCRQNREVMERDLIDDLLPFIQDRYPVSRNRRQNAIAGLSMGGGQSISTGLQNLDRFSKIGGFSSATLQGSFDQIDSLLSGLTEDTNQANRDLDLFWIGCGRDDFLVDRNHHFVEWLKNRGIDHQFLLTEGGHDWMVWRKYFSDFLEAAFPVA